MNIHPSNVFFVDIETVPDMDKWQNDARFKKLFEDRFEKEIQTRYEASVIEDKEIMIEDDLSKKLDHCFDLDKVVTQQIYLEQAAFHAEFNKVICVCVGAIVNTSTRDPRGQLYIKTFTGGEYGILTELSMALDKGKPTHLCAHNGLGFDFPILTRKYWMHDLPVPSKLDNMGKKPWEVNLIDTQQLWGAGQWKASISLDRLSYCLGLPSPKEEMKGSDVLPLYQGGEIQKVMTYCQGDVKALVNAFIKLTGSALQRYEDKDVILK